MNMTIAHIITSLNNGGAEGVLYRLCLHDKNNEHIVISMMNTGKYGPLLQEHGIKVYCLNMQQGRLSLKGIIKLYKLLRAIKPNVVQTWMYHADLIGGIVARIAGIKKIFWNIRHSYLQKGSSKNSTIFIAHVCARLSCIIPTKIICCAHKAKEVHEALGYKAAKLVVIPNGYDFSEYYPDEIKRRTFRSELNISEDTILLGMVGRYDPLKDHHNLLQAIAILSKTYQNFKLCLIGKELNINNNILMNIIYDFDLTNSVLLLDQRKDIPYVMNGLDIHILSSSSEAFPNVIAEAMACGIPCISTNVGDANIIIRDSGWLVPPKQPQALAQAIEIAITEMTSDELWQKRKHLVHTQVSNQFSIQKMISSYQDIWK